MTGRKNGGGDAIRDMWKRTLLGMAEDTLLERDDPHQGRNTSGRLQVMDDLR